MARTKKETPAVPAVAAAAAKKPSTAIAKRVDVKAMEAKLAAQGGADSIKGMIGAPTSNRITLDNKNGKFKLPNGFEAPELNLVVLDFMVAHRYYSGIYDPKNVSPPTCYAFSKTTGSDEGPEPAAMAPFDDSPKKQANACAVCPMAVFGSAANGSAKACKETRDIAVMLVPEEGTEQDETIYTFSVPPTGIKSFDGFIAQSTKLFGHFVKAQVAMIAEDRGTYSSVSFVEPAPVGGWHEYFARQEDAQPLLNRRPDFSKVAAAPAAKARPGRNPALANRR